MASPMAKKYDHSQQTSLDLEAGSNGEPCLTAAELVNQGGRGGHGRTHDDMPMQMVRAGFSDSGSRPYFIRPGSKCSALHAEIARRAFMDPARFYMMYQGKRVSPDGQVPARYNPPVDVTLRVWSQRSRSRSRMRTLRPQLQQPAQPQVDQAQPEAQENEPEQPPRPEGRVIEIVDTTEMAIQTEGAGYAGPTGIWVQVRGHPYRVDLYLHRDEVLRVYEGWDELTPRHVERACLNIYPQVFERGGRLCLLDGIHVMRPDRPIPREHWESATLYAEEDLVLMPVNQSSIKWLDVQSWKSWWSHHSRPSSVAPPRRSAAGQENSASPSEAP